MVARRQELATALTACAESPCRAKARRFLNGLSSDELQFIAEYLGACILESARQCRRSRAELAALVADFQSRHADALAAADIDHKMILLLEFLCRSGVGAAAAS
jgi:hypothetical protein